MKQHRMLSLLLALALAFSLAAPAPAFAAEGSDAVVTASEESDSDDGEAEKKAEEEAKKKAEEEEKKKEEEAKKAEEEAKKKAEEEAKKAEEEKKDDSSGSSGSASSGDSSGGSGDKSGGSSSDPADSSGDSSGAKKNPAGDKSGGDSSGGSDSSDGADRSEEKKDEEQEEKKEEENKDEELETQSSSSSAAKKVSDKTYSSTQYVTAASFSDYSNSSGMATGGTVRYKRLITYKVTGLIANKNTKAAGQKNISQIEKVMRMIRDYNEKGTYSSTVFKVVIPKGTYYIDGTYTSTSSRCVHLYSNTWLSMNGVTLIKRDTKNRASLRTGMSTTSVSGYQGESNIILEGGTWNANTKAHSSSGSHFSSIRFGHDQNVIIANVTFEGAVSGHHVELCGVKNVSVVRCSFRNYKDSGYTKGINRNEALQIDVTNGSNITPSFSKYDDTISGNVVVYKNTFENVNRGVGSHSAIFGTRYTGIVIESNTFQSVTNQAIFCENYQDCAIKNNTITNCGGGIEFNAICYAPDGNYYQPRAGMPEDEELTSYRANTVISGNRIAVKSKSALTNASGIYVHGGVYSGAKYSSLKGKRFTLSGVTVTKNTVTSCRDAGITLAYVNSCKVTKNTISGAVSGSTAKGYGIYLDHCAYGDISSNTIEKNKSHGICLSSCAGSAKKRITVNGNRITAASTGGIGLYLTSSRYISAGKNTVSSSSYTVYLKSCSYCAIGAKSASNTLSTSAKYGIYGAKGSKTGIQVYYNKITAKTAAVKAASGCKINSKSNTFRRPGSSR